ncbi:unnamed protein product, partial [Candidula unifasciata]
MCARRSLSLTVFISQLLLMALLLVTASSSHVGHQAAPSVIKSSSTDIVAASRLKRAPGWGKRNALHRDDFLDGSESALRDINTLAALNTVSPFAEETDFLSDKRAPGWGKRAPGWGKRAPGWGKRSCYGGACLNNLPSLGSKGFLPFGKTVDNTEFNNDDFDTDETGLDFTKRAPGWGKRSYQLDLGDHDAESDQFRNWGINTGSQSLLQKNADAVKKFINTIGALSRNSVTADGSMSAERRAPGWGKRSRKLEFGYGDLNTDKRAPGWGKRAPGWGKRNYDDEIDDSSDDIQKRAPGWGKRAPGWGKRGNAFELEDDSGHSDKRAPGWGKRAPGWGKRSYTFEVDADNEDVDKRAPGWGKRAPGWGKRNYEFDVDYENEDFDKRAPGWGKRAPGWGKRSFRIQSGDGSLLSENRASNWEEKRAFGKSKKAPGWGKRSVREICQEFQGLQRDYIDK